MKRSFREMIGAKKRDWDRAVSRGKRRLSREEKELGEDKYW